MNFFSLEFSVLLLIFLGVYWYFKRNIFIQNFLILFFNYFILIGFFNKPYFALIIFLYSIFIYCAAFFIAEHKTRFMLLSVIFFAILNLAFFKYFPMIKSEFDEFLVFFGFSIDIDFIFPLGLSFYTFASITYLVEVYRGGRLATFKEVAIYLSFFPTIVSGPIMRSVFFFKQLRKKRIFEHGDLIFILLLSAIVKKILIANHLGIWTNQVFENPSAYDTASLILSVFCYSLQLYCDFSGYVDLVIAFGLMMGFTIPLNFNKPYSARNIQEFWNRWHITLSHFIRDFVYIPLGGNRNGVFATYFNILIAFILSGIWHVNTQDGTMDNSLNFVVWGALHGIGVCVIHFFKHQQINIGLPYPVAMLITFCYVSFCWIFFFMPSFDKSIDFILAMVDFSLPMSTSALWGIFGIFILVLVYPLTKNLQTHLEHIFSLLPFISKPIILVLILLIVFASMPDGIPNFIYSRF
ncbi:hypothetical protein CCZ01_05790 [Helicobacter monodelphidis]|uniref:MBOAT family O-acyltransferase n=1 Tax=Helicobacter sp. 15-1451 TaxID=2004995 RepID=UPI000DCCB01F|nr:MBOAT family O-acyltransferase [Helicobacter sp. 15-1451]RAX57494.1 hypothetical protein CCZ01_05790 [Helicobacter sp. 15-1451]